MVSDKNPTLQWRAVHFTLRPAMDAFVASYDTRLQQWICMPLMFLWFNR